MENKQSYLIPFSIIIAGVLIAGAVWYTNGGSRTPVAATGSAGQESAAGNAGESKALQPRENDRVLGNSVAPVTIVEYGDFQCPFCGRLHANINEPLREQYIKTGKVKFIWRDFAFLGAESQWASQAAQCAGDQKKFWEYHDYLFEHQNGENQGAFSVPNLKRFAGVLGLDQEKFAACLDGETFAKLVAQNTQEGRSLGVSGTPTTFINGKSVVGAVAFADMKAVIDAALSAK
jgi:protein-disulfide isomerase